MPTSDELGAKGEARFKELCADASLICNQSERDRTGWDFLVEFPFEPPFPQPAPLEGRRSPLSCHVQIKTILSTTDSVTMRLSVAERLAKEIKPAFIVVLVVGTELQFRAGHLIHILDQPLFAILRRLRKEDEAGSVKINKKTITMSVTRYGKSFELTGAALRAALVDACSHNIHEYAARKTDQLKKLGYPERPMKMSVTLSAGNMEGLVDAFLGIRDQILATNIAVSQTRFDITLPIEEFSGPEGLFTIRPEPRDRCTINFRKNPLSRPAVFRGDVYLPPIPNLPAHHIKVLIRTPRFTVILSGNGCELTPAEQPSKLSLADWRNYWSLCEILALGEGLLEITFDKMRPNFIQNIKTETRATDLAQYQYLARICDCAADIITFAGMQADVLIDAESIMQNSGTILLAYNLLKNAGTPAAVGFSTDYNENLLNRSGTKMLYIDILSIGEIQIAFAGTMYPLGTRRDDLIDWNVEHIKLSRIRRVESMTSSYEQFVEETKLLENTSDAFVRYLENVSSIQ